MIRGKNNTVSCNSFNSNDAGLAVIGKQNSIRFNNFVNNTRQATIEESNNICEYNYWSEWTKPDADRDSIVDNPYPVPGNARSVDRYPLVSPVTTHAPILTPITFYVAWESANYPVVILCNSTISNFAFNQLQKQISFMVTGASDTIGFCYVTIPKQLLWGNGLFW
ncbi:MAG: NosD domain-containing protein [Candidatus Bathyarchaeia archaeon]